MKLDDVESGAWHECGSVRLQWDRLYEMEWDDPELENMRQELSEEKRPIATVRDSRKMILLRGGTTHPTVRIFNCAGRERGRFAWMGGGIVGMGWTAEEQLLVVDDLGEVAIYNIHGQRLPVEFSLGTACAQEKLRDCVVYDSGIVGLTFANSVWVIADLLDVHAQRLADLEIEGHPQCMAVRVSAAHGVEVILACEDALFVVDSYEAVKPDVELGIVTMLEVSPNNELIMAFTEERNLFILRSGDVTESVSGKRDFVPILTFESPSEAAPKQLAWCGNDFALMGFEDDLVLVESDGEWTSFGFNGVLHVVSETDCLRVVTETQHLMLRLVSEAMENVLSPDSNHPGRDLYLARKAYDEQDAKADKNLRDIKEQLPAAIQACIHLAGQQLDIPDQRDLLKTATYGVAFAMGFPNMKLYETCQRLRILNNLRDPEVGIVMTMYQLERQSIQTVISRLINAHHHFLASKICESMGLNQDEVLRHWACARISADDSTTDDEELKSVIVDKLHGCKGVKYATIAQHAQEHGRMNLARLLLEYEVVAADQVPLLLKLGDDHRALRCAIESGDTDLVYFCIFHLYRKLALVDKLNEFSATVLAEKQALDLFIKYCRTNNLDGGKEMLRMKGCPEEEASLAFDKALSISLKIPDDALGTESISVLNMREQVNNLLREASILYSRTKKYELQTKCCEEFAHLRKLQAHVDQSMGRNVLVGLSVVDSVKQCIRLDNQKAAEDFKRAFNLTDKHFWWIKVQTLAEKGDWDGLEAFASLRKSPIGWEPFIKAGMSHNAAPDRVEKFIDRLPDSEEKVEFYSKAGLNVAAARTAASLQNVDLLTKIQGMMGTNTQFGMRTATMIERLKGQGASSSQNT